MTQLHEHPVIVEERRDEGGMGIGMVLGVLLAIVLVVGVVWFALAGRALTPATAPTNNNPTINVNPSSPSIKVPDTITVNPPAQPQGGGSGANQSNGN